VFKYSGGFLSAAGILYLEGFILQEKYEYFFRGLKKEKSNGQGVWQRL